MDVWIHFWKTVLKSNNIFELDMCTECEKGYEIDEDGNYVKKKDE